MASVLQKCTKLKQLQKDLKDNFEADSVDKRDPYRISGQMLIGLVDSD